MRPVSKFKKNGFHYCLYLWTPQHPSWDEVWLSRLDIAEKEGWANFFYLPCFFHWQCAHEAESHLKSYSATVLAVKTGENSMAVGNTRGWKVFDAKCKIELIAVSWEFWWTNRWWWDQTSAWEDFWQDLSQRFLVQLQVEGSHCPF